ncbi:amidohydrolase [Diaporthe helianthi]|uniref:Amidohydrolase n=1 Tax=Diaporthe helianthi TaxID=158607 RepID=A0A2P5I9W0_DIAHE|nr:amidohydrolase [Diaporthe helianthi]
MASQPILLKGGTLLVHDNNDKVVPTRADLLIEGDRIARIDANMSVPASAKVMDCADKLISPGFVSTHAHLWQSQLKGRHADHTLVEYMPAGCYSGTFYSPADLFWGQLAGAMESVDAGTTTVVDHSHLNLGPDYPKTAIQALSTSGLRTVYCYSPKRHISSFSPLKLEEEPIPSPEALRAYEALASPPSPHGNGRVVLGFSQDNIYMPQASLQSLYGWLRGGDGASRTQLITTHAQGGPAFGGRPPAVSILASAGLLGPDVLLSHAPGLAAEDVATLAAAGAFVSSTPNTEMQMGMGPVAMRRDVLAGGVGSLGVDCHTWGTSYMPTQMTLALQARRLGRADEVGREGRWVRHVEGTAADVFNLVTVCGARAVGMAKSIGRLAVGFKADVVVLDGLSPGMAAAAQEDPVAAVVLHSSIRDVESVIIDGVVRKEGGKLCEVVVENVPAGLREQSVSVGTAVGWKDVAREVLKSRGGLEDKFRGVDYVKAEEDVIDMWHMDRSAMVEK